VEAGKEGDAGATERLDLILYCAAETLRIVTALAYPAIPQSAEKIWAQLGMAEPLERLRVADLHWGHAAGGQKLGAVEAVFPRADAKTAIAKMREDEAAEYARQQALIGKSVAGPDARSEAETGKDAIATSAPPVPVASRDGAQITIDDFAKVDLRVGLVKSATAVKGANKLLHLHIDIGEPQPRSIVAGIAEAYQPEALVGRKVVIVANLAPRKLRGLESQGMIVAASLEGGAPVLAGFLEDVPVGARLK
jgi:methionyl-tRNA synthetase